MSIPNRQQSSTSQKGGDCPDAVAGAWLWYLHYDDTLRESAWESPSVCLDF